MDYFEMMLPVFVDYLGCFEEGLDGVNSPLDVMRELNDRGVQENRFLPGGELTIEEDQLVLRDSPGRVRKTNIKKAMQCIVIIFFNCRLLLKDTTYVTWMIQLDL